jgi:hypothetical protein
MSEGRKWGGPPCVRGHATYVGGVPVRHIGTELQAHNLVQPLKHLDTAEGGVSAQGMTNGPLTHLKTLPRHYCSHLFCIRVLLLLHARHPSVQGHEHLIQDVRAKRAARRRRVGHKAQELHTLKLPALSINTNLVASA